MKEYIQLVDILNGIIDQALFIRNNLVHKTEFNINREIQVLTETTHILNLAHRRIEDE